MPNQQIKMKEVEQEVSSFINQNFNKEEAKHYKFIVAHMIMIDNNLLKQEHKQDIIDIVEEITNPNVSLLYNIVKTNMDKHNILPSFVTDKMMYYFKKHL